MSDKFPPLYTGEIISKDSVVGDGNNNLEVFAIIAGQKKMFWNDCSTQTGRLRQRVDQLKLLGFHPIVVIVCMT